MTSRPKTKPWRSEAYRKLVATLPCVACSIEGQSQAAHGPTLGLRIKAGDETCMPLCARRCHPDFDQYAMAHREARAYLAKRWAADTRARLRPACEAAGIDLPQEPI